MEITIIGNLTVDLINGYIRGGGPGYYAGLALAHLGHKVYLIGNVGLDYPSEYLEVLKSYNVILDYLRIVDRSTAFRIKYSETSNRILILENYGYKVVPEQVPRELIDDKVVIVSPVIGEIDDEVIKYIFKSARFIVLDVQGFVREVKGKGILEYVPLSVHSDIISNSHIIHAELNEVIEAKNNPLNAVLKLKEYGANISLLTLSKHGSILVLKNSNTIYKIPALNVVPVDQTGAGDVYTSIFTVKYLEGTSPVEASCWASVAAGLKVARGKLPWYSEDEIKQGVIEILKGVVEIEI